MAERKGLRDPAGQAREKSGQRHNERSAIYANHRIKANGYRLLNQWIQALPRWARITMRYPYRPAPSRTSNFFYLMHGETGDRAPCHDGPCSEPNSRGHGLGFDRSARERGRGTFGLRVPLNSSPGSPHVRHPPADRPRFTTTPRAEADRSPSTTLWNAAAAPQRTDAHAQGRCARTRGQSQCGAKNPGTTCSARRITYQMSTGRGPDRSRQLGIPCSASAHPGHCLKTALHVGLQIIEMLESHRDSQQTGADAGTFALGVSNARMRGRGRMG